MSSTNAIRVFSSEIQADGFLTFYRGGVSSSRNWQRDSRTKNPNSAMSVSDNMIFIPDRGVDRSFQGTRFVSSLPSSGLRLRIPLPVVMYKAGMNYFAYSQDIDLYGMSDDMEGSIDDIKSMVVELWHDLHSEMDHLGPIPKKQLATLRQLICEA